MNKRKRTIQRRINQARKASGILVLLLALCALLPGTGLIDGALAKGTHVNRALNPGGCSSCHKSHGKPGTPMLKDSSIEVCFECHGSVKRGKRGEAATDILSPLQKISNHPIIDTARYHNKGEMLPEKDPDQRRHVSCFDCHNPHSSSPEKTFRGVKGYKGKGVKSSADAEQEYQVCYLCHADSANRPFNSSDISEEFEITNASYHPVERQGKNTMVPSLVSPYFTTSMINCSDCHGNNDPSGPVGPHGSDFIPLLIARYEMSIGPESVTSYQLCYRCHDRNSILNDESFKSHKQHIVYASTPCIGCHDAHGSFMYRALINFDDRISFPNTTGEHSFMDVAPGRPRCYLSCHVNGIDYDHILVNGMYCINNNCPPGW